MTLEAGSPAAQAAVSAEISCPECNSTASGNFCSNCGADLRAAKAGLFGTVATHARLSYPGTYLQILRSPVKATVALADDPTYRQHISFLLTSLAIFCVVIVPFIIQSADPTGAMARYSESMQMLMKVLSQAGVYAGAIFAFLIGYAIFFVFAKTPRTFKAYLKLYCLAYGFMLPPYALYDYVARGILGSTGLTSYLNQSPSLEQLLTVPFAVALSASLLIWAYFIAIHRRFWNMALWKAGVLYTAAALISQKVGYWAMYYIGYWAALGLIRAGIVTP